MKYLFSISTILVGLFLTLTSCSPKLANGQPNKEKEGVVFYPESKDSAKIQYLKSFKSSIDIEEIRSKFNASIIGKQKIMSVQKPYGVTVYNGKIIITDITAKGFATFDLNKKKLNVYSPTGRGGLKLPLNSTVDKNGIIYTADADLAKIKMYNQHNTYLGSLEGGKLRKPTDVVVTKGKIWVCDSQNNRIEVYDQKTKKYLDYFPKVTSKEEGWLYTPTNICLSDTRVYVSDLGASRVSVYNLEGKFIQNIGSRGKNVGQFVRPKGIAVDKEDNLYAVDGAFENVQIFNKKGQLLLYFGGKYSGPKSGGMVLPTAVHVDYDHNIHFENYVDKDMDLKYLIFVANQFGPESITVYGRVEPKK